MTIEQVPQALLFDSNMFLVIGEKQVALIDTGTGFQSGAILSSIDKILCGRSLDLVILTHRHYDHVGGLPMIIDRYQPMVYAGAKDAEPLVIGDSESTMGTAFGGSIPEMDVKSVSEGDEFDLGGHILRIIETPGHTIGSICILDTVTGALFSGDTFFVDGTEEEFAFVSKFLGFRDVVEEPADLGGGEVGVNDEAGLLFDGLEVSLRLQFLGVVRGTAALPDDGVVNGTAGRFVPKDGGLALVGDTDGGDVGGIDLAFAEDGGDTLQLGHEDVFGSVLNPACMRVDLLELSLGFGDDLAILVKDDRSGTGGTLIQSHYIFGHSKVPPL